MPWGHAIIQNISNPDWRKKSKNALLPGIHFAPERVASCCTCWTGEWNIISCLYFLPLRRKMYFFIDRPGPLTQLLLYFKPEDPLTHHCNQSYIIKYHYVLKSCNPMIAMCNVCFNHWDNTNSFQIPSTKELKSEFMTTKMYPWNMLSRKEFETIDSNKICMLYTVLIVAIDCWSSFKAHILDCFRFI